MASDLTLAQIEEGELFGRLGNYADLLEQEAKQMVSESAEHGEPWASMFAATAAVSATRAVDLRTLLTAARERDALLAKVARMREVIKRADGAVSAAYAQADAEHRYHDTIASKYDDIVQAWRSEARAALETAGG